MGQLNILWRSRACREGRRCCASSECIDAAEGMVGGHMRPTASYAVLCANGCPFGSSGMPGEVEAKWTRVCAYLPGYSTTCNDWICFVLVVRPERFIHLVLLQVTTIAQRYSEYDAVLNVTFKRARATGIRGCAQLYGAQVFVCLKAPCSLRDSIYVLSGCKQSTQTRVTMRQFSSFHWQGQVQCLGQTQTCASRNKTNTSTQ
jgi:hypothetical protein